MEEAPGPPQQPLAEFGRPINRKHLWWSLLGPTLVTLTTTIVVGAVSDSGPGADYLPAGIYLSVLWIGALAALPCLAWFVRIIKVRYQGSSVVLLGFAYLLGQIVLQPVLGFCCCLGLVAITS